MDRPRCTRCRNPIRHTTAARRGSEGDSWYHPDCWAELCASEQEKYAQEVESSGLVALLAPYITPRPTVVVPVPEPFEALGQQGA